MKGRYAFAVVACALAVPAPVRAQAAADVAQAVPAPWGMRNADPARTGQSPALGATVGQLEWKTSVAGTVPQMAVAGDGTIFLGTVFNENAWNNESYAYALTPSGALKWREKVTPYDWGASQATSGGPAVDGAGGVLVPSTFTQLLMLSADGDPLWTFQGNPGALIQGSPAVLPDQTIRHAIWPAGLVALSPSGATIFQRPIFNAGTVVAVAANGEMAAGGIRTNEPHGSVDIQYFNADGTLRWQKTSTNGAQGIPIFGPDGTVYAPFLARAYFPDGTVKWTTDVYAPRAALSTAGVLYFPVNGVVAVDSATGARLWTLPLPGGILSDAAIDSAGNVFVIGDDGRLWSISPAGTVNWSLQVCDRFLTGPVVAGGRVLAAGITANRKFVFAVR